MTDTTGTGKSHIRAQLAATKIDRQMDPLLQQYVAFNRTGRKLDASFSTTEDEIAVIARVSDTDAWIGLSEVRVGAEIGPAQDGESTIVTGRIPVQRIEAVRGQDFIKSLKAARGLNPVLHATVEETGAAADQLPQGSLANSGAGVVVGIVDYGCDFAHRNFRDDNGDSRIEALWHQGGVTQAGAPFGYGREFSRDDLTQALSAADPYDDLGYQLFDPNKRGTHGTHVMDIAAGSGGGTGVNGVAPAADIVFVDVSHADLPGGGPQVVGTSFGDSVRLLEALQYIFERADGRPCVINVSLGTNGGPHDGTTLVEQGIDSLLRQAPNRAVVIAASNSFIDGIHAEAQVPANGQVDLTWEIPAPPAQFANHDELEIWFSGDDQFAVELIDPDGDSVGTVEPGNNGSADDASGETIVFVANRLGEPNNDDNMIGIYFAANMPSGSWIVRLHGRQVTDGHFHAWIERDNFSASRFAPPHDNSHTIGSISCGHETIVVGSYDGHKNTTPLSVFSSAGPTRDGRQKPEISAPGQSVVAARSATGDGVVVKSGTSMASPAVAGIVALMLAEAQARGVDVPIGELRQMLIDTARDGPPAGGGWHERYGHGRIDATAAVDRVIAASN